jgi:hypothetical protein
MEDAATVNAKTVSKSGEVDWLNLPTKLTILQAYQKRSYSSMNSAGRVGCSKSRTKTVLEIESKSFHNSTSFDQNVKAMLIGYVRVST